MLRLTFEQVELLEQLALRRQAGGIGAALAQAWPVMTERLKDRWPAFVEAALLQGRKHGLTELTDLAHYAGLWCLWGPSFEDKPGFEWARDILSDARRGPPLKIHQLLHHTRDELQRRLPAPASAAPVVTLAQFDAALAAVDQKVAASASVRAIFPSERVAMAVKACDLSVVDMMVADVDGLQEYRHGPAGWQRAVVPRLALPAVQWTRAPDGPVLLAVPSHALRAGPAARLNLKVQMLAVCDVKVHPELVHNSAQGRLAWKGRDTQRLSLALYAPTLPPPVPGASPPGIAAPLPADAQQVSLTSCALRDAGAPFGDLALTVNVFPAAQWLTEVSHPAWPALAWSASEVPEPAMPAVKCRLEVDGAPRDATAWQKGWNGLQPLFRQGLEKLFNAWNRALDAQATRLEAEVGAMIGQAGLTWGCRRVAADRVDMRAEGQLDFIACAIDLHLSGEIVQSGARSRIHLLCKGRSELRMAVSQLGEVAAEGQDLKSVARSWRFPFSVQVEPIATASHATLSAGSMPAPLLGALAGECGLRPRPDGQGQQWFFSLRVEPVSVIVASSDPVLGNGLHTRALLAAMPLVDWSAG